MNRREEDMEENRLRELVNQVCKVRGVTKSEISKEMGYKDPTTFFATIQREAIGWQKFQKMLIAYDVDINLIFN